MHPTLLQANNHLSGLHGEDPLHLNYDLIHQVASQQHIFSNNSYNDTDFQQHSSANVVNTSDVIQLHHGLIPSTITDLQSSQQLEHLPTTMFISGLYKCPKCFYSNPDIIDYRNHLNSHLVLHEGQCPFCPYNTLRHDNLKTHVRRHTGEKPYSCLICSRCFSCRSDLNVHRKIHSTEKPFKCGLCNFRGVRKVDIRMHCRAKHGEESML